MNEQPELRITMRHVRAARLSGVGVLCAPGIRAWCNRHNVDLHELAERGLPLSQIEAIDDAFTRRIVAIARAEADRTHG